jgi:hypothetical protein
VTFVETEVEPDIGAEDRSREIAALAARQHASSRGVG